MRIRKAVVVGGGLGGLAVGVRLRAAGWHVTICEAGPTFGGKMNTWSKDGFTFDTGPSLITMPWVFRDTFAAAGERLEDHVELVPLDPICEYRFDDGMRFDYGSQLPDWLATLRKIAPGDVDGFFAFLNLGARLFEVSEATFFRRSPFEAPSPGEWRALRHVPLRHGWGNYRKAVEHFFQSPHLRQLYSRYPTYVGSSPYLSPATLAVIPYIEYAFGGYGVRGGLYGIVGGLVSIARRLGVELQSSTRVSRVLTDGGKANGVELENGQRISADVVVVNGDVEFTRALLGKPVPPPRSRSMSGFVQLFGLRQPLQGIREHTVCFSADYQREFSQIFDQQRFPDDPTVYVNAPGNGDTLFVMANAPGVGDASAKWTDSQVASARQRVFDRLGLAGFPDFRDDVVVSDIWSPARIESTYLTPGGSIYGSDSHGWRNAFLRPSNRNPDVSGLYHVGGTTHPGGGTPTVLMSAAIVARQIGAPKP